VRTTRRALVLGFVLGAASVVALTALLWFALASVAPNATHPFQPQPSLSAGERRGEAIYVANCQTCHGGRTGGSMMEYPPRHNANGHTWHHPVAVGPSDERFTMFRGLRGGLREKVRELDRT